MMGRPKIDVSLEEFKKLCEIHCTKEEICAVFSISLSTLERRCQEWREDTFDVLYKEYSAVGKKSLRRRMFDIAMDKEEKSSLGACIWLSKQHLGMKDKHEDDTYKDLVPLVIKTSEGEYNLTLGKKKDANDI